VSGRSSTWPKVHRSLALLGVIGIYGRTLLGEPKPKRLIIDPQLNEARQRHDIYDSLYVLLYPPKTRHIAQDAFEPYMYSLTYRIRKRTLNHRVELESRRRVHRRQTSEYSSRPTPTFWGFAFKHWHVISLVVKDIAVINIGFLNTSSSSSSLQQLLRPSPSSLLILHHWPAQPLACLSRLPISFHHLRCCLGDSGRI
jgi:hypothetical protein